MVRFASGGRSSPSVALADVPLIVAEEESAELWDQLHSPAAVPSLPAGEQHIGQVGGDTTFVSFTPLLSVGGTYAANDYVGPSAVPVVIPNCVRKANGTGVIQSVRVVDMALQSIALEIWLFDRMITVPTDNEAWSITDADAQACVGVIAVAATDYLASALNSVATVRNVGLAIKTSAEATALYAAIVTRGAPTYASGQLVVTMGILED